MSSGGQHHTHNLKPLPLPGTLNLSALRASAPSSPVDHPPPPPPPPLDQPHPPPPPPSPPSGPSVESPPDRTRQALEPTLHLLHQALAATEVLARETLHFSDDSLPRLATHLSHFTDVLAQLDALAADPAPDNPLNQIWIPKPVLDAVDRGENPHQVTLGAMDRTAADNQYLNGKLQAAGMFARAMHDELAKEFADDLAAVDAYLASNPPSVHDCNNRESSTS